MGGDLSPLNGVAAVLGLLVGEAFPDHDPAVVGGLLHDGDDAVEEVLGVDVPHLLLRRRQADVDLRVRVRLGPLVPLRLPVGRAIPFAVHPHVDPSNEPRRKRTADAAAVREPAPRRGHQLHRRPRAEALVERPQAPRQHVVVVRRAVLDEEVDAVHVRVPERTVRPRARAGEVGEPEVVRKVLRRLRAGERVPVPEAADGEVHEVAVRLAVLDVGAEAGDRVARDVEVVLAVAEHAQERDDHDGVRARVAGLAEGALRLVPAPEHRHLPGLPRGRSPAGEEDGGKCHQGQDDGGCPPA
jgi:hypothetical protein